MRRPASPALLPALALALVAAALPALVAAALPALASAQDRAIVTTSDRSRDDAQARRAVADALDGVVTVISRDDVARAAQAAHEDPSSPAAALVAARSLRADFVITVSVEGRGARARTTIAIVSAEGVSLARSEVGPPFGRIGAQNVGDAAITLVQEAQNNLARRRSGQAWDGIRAQSQGPSPPPSTASTRSVGAPPWVRAVAGLDVRFHDASVDLMTGGRRSYASGASPELAGALEVHPLLGLGAAAGGLYLRGEGAIAVGIDTQDDPSLPHYTTNAWRVAGALGYLGTVADGVVGLGGSVAVGLDAFEIDETAQTIYPSTRYTFVRLGLDARFALVRDLLTLGVSGGYRVVLATGDLDWAFGYSTTGGFDVRGELGGTLDLGFTWALRLGYERYSATFDGTPGTFGIGRSAYDQSIRVGAFMGWSFY